MIVFNYSIYLATHACIRYLPTHTVEVHTYARPCTYIYIYIQPSPDVPADVQVHTPSDMHIKTDSLLNSWIWTRLMPVCLDAKGKASSNFLPEHRQEVE